MLKECSAPMTAHESCTENISLGREVCGDEVKDVQRDTVDGSEGVLQFANRYKYGGDVAFELRNYIMIIGDAEVVVSESFYEMSLNVQRKMR